MRVLMVAACPLPWPRGTPIRIHRMAEALSTHGHDVVVMTYPLGSPDGAPPYHVRRVAPGLRMSADPGPSLRKLLVLDPLLTRALARALRHEHFDVIHAHHYEGLLAALVARRIARSAVPLVYDSHTLLNSELQHYRLPVPRGALRALGLSLDRRLPPRADHVIAVTRRMQDWFTTAGRITPARVSLISNGVESDHFDPGAAAANGLGKEQAAGSVVRRSLVFSGNLAGYQGIQLLLDAFARVRAVREDVELVFVTGSDTAPARAAASRAGVADRVRFLADDYALLPARLAAADVLVNPRVDADGVPQKLLNYMAAGRPIVSFAGTAAVLAHDVTALVVDDDDSAAFAAAILRLLDDAALGARLGAAARREAVSAHGWGQVAQRVGAVYESVLAARS